MKNALKTFLILVLCLAVAGGTGYLFFVNLTKRSSAFDNINSFVKGSSQKELLINMQQLSTTGGDRFNVVIDTYNDMQQCLQCLNTCLIDYKNASAENSLCDKLDSLISQTATIEQMVDEYNLKSTSESFNKLAGANNVYEEFADFTANYAKFILSVKTEVLKIVNSTNVDPKFAVFDIYANVVYDSLKNLKVSNENNFENLNYMLAHFNLENGYLISANPNGNFAIENNKFIELYNKCNGAEFAANLVNNINLANNDDENNQLKAAYYLKIILGE